MTTDEKLDLILSKLDKLIQMPSVQQKKSYSKRTFTNRQTQHPEGCTCEICFKEVMKRT